MMTLKERWERKNGRAGLDDCWIWQGAKLPKGYGTIPWRGDGKQQNLYAHRVSYELHKGKIPEGKEIDHTCKNPSCSNPKHLEAVSPLENRNRSLWHPILYAKRTSCKNGHAFTPENTRTRYVNGRPSRQCRACDSMWHRVKRHGKANIEASEQNSDE